MNAHHRDLYISAFISLIIYISCEPQKNEEAALDILEDEADILDAIEEPPEGACTSDIDCSDGLICNGTEQCLAGECLGGIPPVCEDNDPCTTDYCSEEKGGCAQDPLDADQDGYAAERAPDGTVCQGNDCDDENADRYPGAPVECEDGQDLDCDGLEDRDKDGDGYEPEECGGDDCNDLDENVHPEAVLPCHGGDVDCDGRPENDRDMDGYIAESCGGNDCNDEDDRVHPDRTEEDCDGLDNNCDGRMSVVEDFDRDGHASLPCGGDDCDDRNESIHPDQEEIACNGLDDDCDELQDLDYDFDEDGFVSADCGGLDCDDENSDVNPDHEEVSCNGLDDDCDGFLHAYEDPDSDGFASIECGGEDCDDADPLVHPDAYEILCDGTDDDCDGHMSSVEDADRDGHASLECWGDDCDDSRADVNPEMAEQCDNVDHDCDGDSTWMWDDDRDGYGDIDCGGTDCNDEAYFINPGVQETYCNAIDDNCDGHFHPDEDVDGDGHVSEECGGDDCNDSNGSIHPDAGELCDGVDNDCDGILDPWQQIGGKVAIDPYGSDHGALFRTVAWTGSEYGVGFNNGAKLFYLINSMGSVISFNDYIGFIGGWYNPSLVWTGSQFGVTSIRGPYDHQVLFWLINADGSLISDPILIDPNGGDAEHGYPISWNGTHFAISWIGSGNTYFARLNPDASMIGDPVLISSGEIPVALVWNGSGYGLFTPSNIYPLSEDGSFAGDPVINDINISICQGNKNNVVWNGEHYFLAEPVGYQISIKKINIEGYPADSTIIDCPTCDFYVESCSCECISITTANSLIAIAWLNQRQFAGDFPYEKIYFSLLNEDLSRVSGDIFLENTVSATMPETKPGIAWTGSEFGVFYTDGGESVHQNAIIRTACIPEAH